MDIKKLRYFVTVAEWRNFTTAAEKCFLSQPALSKNIRDLEYELGVSLFNRSKTIVSLTPEGQALLPMAYKLLAMEEDFCHQAKAMSVGRMGSIRIGYFGYWEFPFLCQVVRAFSKSHPYIVLDFGMEHHGLLRRDLRLGQFDLTFTLDKEQPAGEILPNISWMPIATSELYAFVSEDHHLASRERITLKDLENEYNIIVSRSRESVFNAVVNQAFLDAGLECNYYPAFPLNSMEMLLHVVANHGVNISTRWWKLANVPGVKIIPLDADIPRIQFGVAYWTDRQEDTIQAFLNCVKEMPTDIFQREDL